MIKGSHHTKEAKEKLSKTHIGKHHTEESKRKISENNKGKHYLSGEDKRKLSEARKGIIFTEEHKRNLSKVKKGKHRSKETLQKLRKANLGSKSHFWKGGISGKTQERLNNYKWGRLARQIRKRDNYICQQCEMRPAYDVHHIIPWRFTHNDNKVNLITVCRSCHRQLDSIFIDNLPTLR